MGIVRVWSWSSREEFLVPGFVFRVYSLRFRDVSWSNGVRKSATQRGIYAQVRTNDARARETKKKPTVGELFNVANKTQSRFQMFYTELKDF